jgi:hypothetical protein
VTGDRNVREEPTRGVGGVEPSPAARQTSYTSLARVGSMDTEAPKRRLRNAGITVWRATALAVAAILVIVMYAGIAYLVYRGKVGDGPLFLFTGVILGYVLRSARNLL